MDDIFINSENRKISYPNRLILVLSDEINLKRSDKYIVLTNLSTCYTCKNIKNPYINNKFKISVPMWFTWQTHSVLDIQNYFVIKKVYHQKTRTSDWQFSNKNIYKSKRK